MQREGVAARVNKVRAAVNRPFVLTSLGYESDSCSGRAKARLNDRKLWQQSDNVPFEQSRNVPLTVPGWWDGRRATTDDASR